MKKLFKQQYETAKILVEKINTQMGFYNELRYEDSERLKEMAISSFEKAAQLLGILATITGNKCSIYLDGSIIIEHGQINTINYQQVFKDYEKVLLDRGLIEYGDTLTEEQKMAYYHQQEMEQYYKEYYREF